MFTIDTDWFKVWPKSRYPILAPELCAFVSWYSPHFFKSSERPEDDGYSCALVWGIFEPAEQDVENRKAPVKSLKETSFMSPYTQSYSTAFSRGYNIILLSVLPLMKIDASQLIKYIESLQNDYLNTCARKTYADRSPKFMIMPALEGPPSLILQEAENKVKSMNLRPFFFKNHGNNLDELLTLSTSTLSEGRVWICSHPTDKTELRNLDKGMLEVLSGYPSTQSTAMTWALCQAILQLKLEGIFDKEESKNYKGLQGVKLF